jgi:hypothetical protein
VESTECQGLWPPPTPKVNPLASMTAHDEEREHLRVVLSAFLQYPEYTLREVDAAWRRLCSLTPDQARRLPPSSLGPKLNAVKEAVANNQVRAGACKQG